MANFGCGADRRHQIGVPDSELFDIDTDRSGRCHGDGDDITTVRDGYLQTGSGQPRTAVRVAAGVAAPVDHHGRRLDPERFPGHHAQQRGRQGEPVTVGGKAVPSGTLGFQVVQQEPVPVQQMPPVRDIHPAAGRSRDVGPPAFPSAEPARHTLVVLHGDSAQAALVLATRWSAVRSSEVRMSPPKASTSQLVW